MKSDQFISEIFSMGNPFGETPKATSADVRKVFLQDFLNDAFTALNTAVNTGVVNLDMSGTSAPSTTDGANASPSTTTNTPFSTPIAQTPKGQELSKLRKDKQALAQKKVDDLSEPQYKQTKPLTPSEIRKQKQAQAAAKVDQQTKQQYAQNVNAKKAAATSATKDPATVLEALDVLKDSYIFEQIKSQSLSDFIIDFFDDYVAGANVDYSRFNNQIKTLAQQFEREYQINPKGMLGGYSRNLRSILTQLGDLALYIYHKGRRQTGAPQMAAPGVTLKQTSAAMDALVSQYVPPTTTAAGTAAEKDATQPELSKTQIDNYIKSLSTRDKLKLINYIQQTMPAGNDLR